MLLVLPSKVLAQEPVTIAVPDAATKAGETLELVMSVRNSTGISGAGLTVIYDTQAMRLTDIVSLTSGNFLKDLDRSNFSWLKGKDLTGDFDLVKLCFEVSDRASGTYTVSAELTGNLASNITNQNAVPVPAEFVPGTVTVEKAEVPGGSSGGGGGGGGSVGGGGATGESTDEASPEEPAEIVFEDVPADAYYYDAVLWAVEKKITSGTSATAFTPNSPCTRAQMATFLWRAAGSPEPKSDSNPFTDVTANAYYAKAVQWAVEQGITKGTSATAFSPNTPCSRAQMATFIYRNEQANGGGFNGTWMFLLPFTDVAEWAYEPIAWCYKEGITSGTTATTFASNAPCTRAQMVTFLYRYMK